MSLVKSKQRVADHGEVFTPAWLVEEMLDLVKGETERIDSRFLEPACGSGNFLTPILHRKLATVNGKYGKNEFEKRHHALLALMSIYGIELLPDNVVECRNNLLEHFIAYLNVERENVWALAAAKVLDANIVQGDALTMTISTGDPIVFPEWAYLRRGKYQRRDFRYDTLTERSSYEGTLFAQFEGSSPWMWCIGDRVILRVRGYAVRARRSGSITSSVSVSPTRRAASRASRPR